MARKGDRLPGDALISTHICPDAPVIQHSLVTMMNSPVDMATLNAEEVLPEMEAVLLEVAKAFGQGTCRLYEAEEWAAIQRRYGSMKVLQTLGKGQLVPSPEFAGQLRIARLAVLSLGHAASERDGFAVWVRRRPPR
jgi:hypothetical protein